MQKLNKNTKILLIGSFISSVGDWLNILALMTLVVKYSDKGSFLATFFIIQTIPQVIFGPLIAGVINHLNKKKVLIFTCLLQAIIVLLIPLTTSLYQIYSIAFILSAINIFLYPTIQSTIPLIVSKDELINVNSIFNGLASVVSIISPVISGLIITTLTLSNSFFLDSASFLFFSVIVVFLKIDSSVTEATEFKLRDVLSNSKEGLNYIVKNKILFRVEQGVFLANMSFGIIIVTELLFFKKILKIAPNYYGLFVAVAGAGFLLGSILIKQLQKRNIYHLFAIGIVGMGISIILFAMNTNIILACVLLIAEGIGEAFFTITSITLIQENTNIDNRPGIFTFNRINIKTASLISMIVAGGLVDIIYEKNTMFLAGVISVTYILVLVKNRFKSETLSPEVISEKR